MTSAERLAPAQRAALEALLAVEPLRSVLACLSGQGEEARIVGGAVRNTLIGLALTDVDIATTALPQETIRRAKAAGFKPVPTGVAHGTVTVVARDQPFEVTTLREDVATDGRRATVRFGRDFTHDAERRDFTINALMLSADGILHDPVGGLPDLARGQVRFIGDARARITEDVLRILRFFRFHAAFGAGEADAIGLAACIEGRDGLAGLSRERIRSELMKTLMAKGAVAALALMSDTGLWQRVTGGIAMPHRLEAMLRVMPEAGAAERLAAACVLTQADAERLRVALKLSNAEHEVVRRAALALEAVHGAAMPDARTARQLAYRLGHAPFMLAMAWACPGLEPGPFTSLAKDVMTPAFPFSGRDAVMAGMPAGPGVGQVLARAEALWIEADFPLSGQARDDVLTKALQGHLTVGGIEDRIESTLPPVFSPKIVPRS